MATTLSTHKLIFQLPVLHDNKGQGYVTTPQECENVNWRYALFEVENGFVRTQLMCNQEDRSNFWSLEITFELAVLDNGKEMFKQSGNFTFRAGIHLMVRIALEPVKKFVTKEKGMITQFIINVVKKVGIRSKRIHDFTVPHKQLRSFAMIVEGKKIYVNKQIVALNSEILMALVYPEDDKTKMEVELPNTYRYEKMLRLVKLFYNDSDALTPTTVDEMLELATNLKSDNARQRCERWISKTPSMSARNKMNLAEKYALVELQNECVAMLKTSQQVQRLFESPHEFSDTEIVELMDKVTLSIVGRSYDGVSGSYGFSK